MSLFVLSALLAAVSVLRIEHASSADTLFGGAVVALPVLLGVFLPARRYCVRRRRGTRWLDVAARLIGGALCGSLLASIAVQSLASRQLPETLHGQVVTVSGTVIGLPQQVSRRTRFDLRLDRADAGVAPALLRQVARGARWRLFWYEPAFALHPGQTLRVKVRVKRPQALANPGGADYVRHLLRADVTATGVVQTLDVESSHASVSPLDTARQALQGFRARASSVLSPPDDPVDIRGLVAALAVGDTSRIDRTTRATLASTGTAHLLAISGLHVTLVAGLGFLSGRALWHLAGRLADVHAAHRLRRARQRVAPRGPGAVERELVAAVVAVAFALAYALVAGLSLPTQRALCMLAAGLLWLRWHRSMPGTLTWALALGAVLLIDVVESLSVGLWLSFGTIAMLGWLHAGRPRRRLPVLTALDGHARLGVLMLPVGVACFGTASLVAPLANLFAVPVVGLIAVPLALFATACTVFELPLADQLGALALLGARLALAATVRVLSWLAALPGAAPELAFGSVAMTLAAVVGALLAFAPRGLGLRAVAIPLVLPALWFNALPRSVDGFEVHVLDVGQGTAALVLTAAHTVLIDTGDRRIGGESHVDDVILPALRRLGRRRIDRIVVSHADRDHAGGSTDLWRRYPDARWYASDPGALPLASAARTAVSNCRAGDAWLLDGVWFSFLHPAVGDGGTDNDLSCVLLVHHGAARALFPGDIEAAGERRLLGRAPPLPVTLLLAPHHGSRSSSSAAFVQAFRPRHVVHTAGRDNRFGFPHDDVRMRYTVSGARQHVTGRDGAIAFRFDRRGLVGLPQRWREHRPRWWHR